MGVVGFVKLVVMYMGLMLRWWNLKFGFIINYMFINGNCRLLMWVYRVNEFNMSKSWDKGVEIFCIEVVFKREFMYYDELIKVGG